MPEGFGLGGENDGRGATYDGRGGAGAEASFCPSGLRAGAAGLSFSPISEVRPYYLPNPCRPSKCAQKTARCTKTCGISLVSSDAWSSDFRVPRHFEPWRTFERLRATGAGGIRTRKPSSKCSKK